MNCDPESPGYGRPAFYTLSSGTAGQLKIHPSRLVILQGAVKPDPELDTGDGWGDSVLLAISRAIKDADASAANIASLVFEAKVDVIKIPNFMASLADEEYEQKVLQRLTLAAMAKGVNGALLLDAEEEYEQKQAQFGGLVDLLMGFMQLVSGASDIPMTRLLGQSPGGLNASGESDLRNYYDRISSNQELVLQPALQMLDECLIRSALGTRPPEVFYSWRSLWQTTDKERADIGKTTADTIKTIADTRLIPESVLVQVAANMLTEAGVAPGLEAEMLKYGESTQPDSDEQDDDEQRAAATPVAAAAARMEASAGRSLTATVSAFDAIAKEPVEGLLKLNDAERFLTAAQLQRITTLREEGRSQEAANEAFQIYAAHLDDVANRTEAVIPGMSKGWRDIKDDIGGAWSALGSFTSAVVDLAGEWGVLARLTRLSDILGLGLAGGTLVKNLGLPSFTDALNGAAAAMRGLPTLPKPIDEGGALDPQAARDMAAQPEATRQWNRRLSDCAYGIRAPGRSRSDSAIETCSWPSPGRWTLGHSAAPVAASRLLRPYHREATWRQPTGRRTYTSVATSTTLSRR